MDPMRTAIEYSREALGFMLLPPVLLLFALAAASLLCARHLPFTQTRAGVLALDILMYASFASCAFWVWKMKGFRWFAGSLVTVLELPVLGAFSYRGNVSDRRLAITALRNYQSAYREPSELTPSDPLYKSNIPGALRSALFAGSSITTCHVELLPVIGSSGILLRYAWAIRSCSA